jgi:hypothetical protein
MQAPQAQSKVLNADGPGVARSRSLPTAGAFAPVARGLWRSIALCLSITLVLETGAGAQPAMPVAAQSGASAANQTGVSVDSLLPRYDAGYDIVTPVQARHGMVVSDHRLASEIGLQVLREGGNAVDAAVAVGYALAVVLPQRAASFPDVPTLVELGIKDLEFSSWAGLLAPKGTPKEIVAALSQNIDKVMQMPDVLAKLKQYDYIPVKTTPEVFAQQIQAETDRWKQVVKETGFKLE